MFSNDPIIDMLMSWAIMYAGVEMAEHDGNDDLTPDLWRARYQALESARKQLKARGQDVTDEILLRALQAANAYLRLSGAIARGNPELDRIAAKARSQPLEICGKIVDLRGRSI
jgi:hypothetical protein